MSHEFNSPLNVILNGFDCSNNIIQCYKMGFLDKIDNVSGSNVIK